MSAVRALDDPPGHDHGTRWLELARRHAARTLIPCVAIYLAGGWVLHRTDGDGVAWAFWWLAGTLEGLRRLVLAAPGPLWRDATEPWRYMEVTWSLLILQTAAHLAVVHRCWSGGELETIALLSGIYLVLVAVLAESLAWDLAILCSWVLPMCAMIGAAWWFRPERGSGAVAMASVVALWVLIDRARRGMREQEKVDTAAERERELTRDLHDAQREARIAAQAKARFFAAASHDLRQPLHALSVNATTLQLVAGRGENAVIREVSDGILRSLAHSDQLLDGLLDISRLDASASEPNVSPTETTRLVVALVDEFTALARHQGITLTAVHEAPNWVSSDRDMLARVLRNLISNALKFTPAGGSVQVESRRVQQEIVLLVKDSGPGIPYGLQERIFEEFYQVGNPARDRSKGLGLGLAIVKRLATALGTEVQVDSVPGRGTCFSLRLPAIAGGGVSAVESDGGPAAADGCPTLPGCRVMVVDDEADVLVALRNLLTEVGALPLLARDGTECDALLDAGAIPDVLVVDYRLGGETGLDLLSRVRARLGPVPAVIITGDMSDSRLRAAGDARTTVVGKPLSGDRFIRLLAAALDTASDPPSAG